MEATIENSIQIFADRLEGFQKKDPTQKEIDKFGEVQSKMREMLRKLQKALKDNYFCYSKLLGEGWSYELPSLSAISKMQTFPEESIEARVYTLIVHMRNLIEKGRDDEEMRKISIVFLETRRTLDDIDTSLTKMYDDYLLFLNGRNERNQQSDPLSDWYKSMRLQKKIEY